MVNVSRELHAVILERPAGLDYIIVSALSNTLDLDVSTIEWQ